MNNIKFKTKQVIVVILSIFVFCAILSFIAQGNHSANIKQETAQQVISQEYSINVSPINVLNTFSEGVLNKGYFIKGDIYQTKSKDN